MSRVSTTNPFDLLGDENEDRSNVPTPAKKEQKPAAPAAKPAAKPAATSAAAKPAAPKPDAAKTPAKPADSKAAAKPAGGNSANQTVKPAAPREANQNLQERQKETRAPRDTRDGPRAPRPADDGKRQYDRKSGTGRAQNEVKKGGSGKGNWGGEVDAKDGAEALQDKEAKTADENLEEENKEEKVAVEGGKKDEAAKEGEKKEEPAKEPETRTMEEYLASKKKAPVVVAALKPRTVEDQDFSAAGFVPLERGEAGVPPLMQKEKKDKKKKETKKEEESDKKADKTENLAAKLLTFASHQEQKSRERGYGRNYDDRRREGGDNRRGGGRGGGFRGNRPAGDAAGSSQLPVGEKDFPSLSPHAETAPSVKA